MTCSRGALQCGDLEEENATVKQVVVLKGTAGQGLEAGVLANSHK